MAKADYPGTGDNSPGARAQRETHWRRVVERWRASGLAKSAFCAREGISDASLHWWLREISRRDAQGKPAPTMSAPKRVRRPRAAFVPVRVMASAQPALELVVAGKVLRVPAGFDPDALRRLLACLEDPAC